MTDFKYIEAIENYTSNQMTKLEETSFKEKLAKNPELAKELQDFQKIKKMVSAFGQKVLEQHEQTEKDGLKNKLRKASAVYHQQTKVVQMPIRKTFYRNLAVAASFLLLLGMGLFYLVDNTTVLNIEQVMVSTHDKQLLDFEKIIFEELTYEGKEEYRKLYFKILQKDGISEASQFLVSKVAKNKLMEEEDAFLYGYDFFRKGDFTNAIVDFKEFIKEENFSKNLRYHARWLLALSYYRMGDFDNAQITAEQVLSNPYLAIFEQEAKDLIILIETSKS